MSKSFCHIFFYLLSKDSSSSKHCFRRWLIFLPDIYISSVQPLQPSHIQDRQLVSCQAELFQASQLLQDRRDTAETVEGQAEVGEALQRAQLCRKRAYNVPVQEESLQAGQRRRGNS